MEKPKLLIDEMLENLVSWLRIFGVDTAHIRPRDDDELMEYAEQEDRVLVTRDRELSERCGKREIGVVLLPNSKAEEQLRILHRELGNLLRFPEAIRCPGCNTPLEVSDKASVLHLLPPKVLGLGGCFWRCRPCEKAYWEGTHWENIQRVFRRVTAEGVGNE